MVSRLRLALTVASFGMLSLFAPPPARAGDNVWTTHGPAGSSISAIALDPNNDRILYAASSDSGVFKSADGGMTWGPLGKADAIEPALQGLTCLSVDPADARRLYIGNDQGTVLRSSDGGQTWIATTLGDAPVSAIVVDPASASAFAATRPSGNAFQLRFATPVWRSSDRGETWHSANLGTPRGIYALLADRMHKTLFAASDFAYEHTAYGFDYPRGGGVERTQTGEPGVPWQGAWSLSSADLEASITALAGDPAGMLLYSGASSGGVFRSSDGGSNWQPVGYAGGSVAALALDPSSPSTLYAAVNEAGLRRSVDSGATWRPFDDGLTNLAVTSLAITSDGRTLHAATRAGVFDRQLPPASAVPCAPSPGHLCLLGARFRAELTTTDPHTGLPSPALAADQGDRFGYFSFPALTGDASLPEVFVKMLDASSIPGQGFWVFSGSLTSLPYRLVITDTLTGRMQLYDGKSFCGSADTSAFPPDVASDAPAPPAASVARAVPSDTTGSTLALLSGRFRIQLTASDPASEVTGSGIAIPQGDRFGYFSLPSFTGDPILPEVFVKIIDATSLPQGDFWLFYSGLTDLSYSLIVTDTVTGMVKTYRNDPSDPLRLCGGVDIYLAASPLPPQTLTGEWVGTTAELPAYCLFGSGISASAAAVTQSGDRVQIDSLATGCLSNLRFDGQRHGSALEGAFRFFLQGCHFESAATGTVNASAIHLVSGPASGTCGAFIGVGLDLAPSPLDPPKGIAGEWTGTFDSFDLDQCAPGIPARATLAVDGTNVTGTLTAPQSGCGIENVRLVGTLDRGIWFNCTVSGDRFADGSQGAGRLLHDGVALEIKLTNAGPGLAPGGTMHLHR